MSDDVEAVKAACQTPPCPLFQDRDDMAWANRVRRHVASGEHSGERSQNAMFIRLMEKEFQRAMGGKGRWE